MREQRAREEQRKSYDGGSKFYTSYPFLLLRRHRRKSLCRFSHKILLYNKTSCASLIFGSCVLSTAKKKPRVSPLNKPCNLSSAARLPSPASKNFTARRWYFTHNLQRAFPIKRYSNNLRCRVCKRALEPKAARNSSGNSYSRKMRDGWRRSDKKHNIKCNYERQINWLCFAPFVAIDGIMWNANKVSASQLPGFVWNKSEWFFITQWLWFSSIGLIWSESNFIQCFNWWDRAFFSLTLIFNSNI